MRTRALAVWVLLMLLEVVQGTFRVLYLEPRWGVVPARQAAVLWGSLCIVLIAIWAMPWIVRGAQLDPGGALRIGGAWVALTLAFELGAGRGFGRSWDSLLADYDPRQGGLMLIGMLALLAAPAVGARLRGLIASREPRNPIA
jgi:hypothetical protein